MVGHLAAQPALQLDHRADLALGVEQAVVADVGAIPLELALSGEVPAQLLQGFGWRLADANAVSRDP